MLIPKYSSGKSYALGLLLRGIDVLIPRHSSIFSRALGLLIKSVFSIGLPVCYVFACQDFGVSSVLGISVAGLLGVGMIAVLLVLWAVGQCDISGQRLRENFPGWFKKSASPNSQSAAEFANTNIFQTRYLSVPTPPPRFCLAIARLRLPH